MGPRFTLLLTTAVLATAVVVVLAVDPLRAIAGDALDGDLEAVREGIDDLGAWAAVVLVVLVLVHAVIPFPAEIPTAAAGFALGIAAGLPLMLAAWLGSALVTYWLAQVLGRPVAARAFGAGRLERLERAVARGGVRALLVARLIPVVPFNLVCAAAALARVPLWRYSWTTVVGFAPLTTIVVVLGARLQEPDLTDPVLWGSLLALIALVLLVPLLRGRRRETSAD